jgi:uncharacterized protein GlcG (DUF336 family)
MNTGRIIPIAIVGLALAAPAAAQLQTKKTLTLSGAKHVAQAAEALAKENNWRVAIAVLDDGGHLLYFQRMDSVQLGSIEVALRKAESALKFRRPGKVFADDMASRPQVMVLPGAFPFEGGLPIVHEGEVIGSIGVSGVASNQDAMIAKAGLDALAKMLGR